MPTYQYKCTDCGQEFDFFQSMSSETLTKWPNEIEGHSPNCPGNVKRKISSGSGVVLKGTGFYETDYVKKSNKSSE